MTDRQRLSASVDAGLLAAGHAAVAAGRAPNLSAWVNEALSRQVDHERRTAALDDFLAAYEAEHGEITDEEISQASRRARRKSVAVRGEGAA